MLQWINNRFGVNLQEEDITSIKDFSLVWNVFEGCGVFSTNFSITKLETHIQNINFDLTQFQNQFEYFSNRYVANGQTNNRFDNLNFRRTDRKQFVADVLCGNLTTPRDIILALAIIVYRLRNNFFHGSKDIRVIDQQNENFINANSFLTTLLNYL